MPLAFIFISKLQYAGLSFVHLSRRLEAGSGSKGQEAKGC